VNAGVKKWWNGRRDECWAGQWRTRMFECLATHQVGKPSTRTEAWLQDLIGYFASDSSNQDKWQVYLDNLQKLGIKRLQLDHLQNGPTNLGKDEVVVQCFLPFLNNGFPYVPLSLKLWNFLKVDVYDPSEGKIFGANLKKLTSQYTQYIFDELDYKGESYKTGYDGEEGCPTSLTIPRAVDEWGNAIDTPGHSQEASESFELNFTAKELAAVDLTDRLGTFEVGNAPYYLPFLQSASKPPPQLPRPLPPPPMRRHRQHHRHRPATPPPHQHQSPSSPSSHSCLHLCSITWSVRESFAQRCNVELSSWVPARRLKAPSPELCSLRLVGRVPARCL